MRQWNATAFCHLIRQKKFLFFWTRPTIDDRLTDIDDVSFDRQSKILSCLQAFLIAAVSRCLQLFIITRSFGALNAYSSASFSWAKSYCNYSTLKNANYFHLPRLEFMIYSTLKFPGFCKKKASLKSSVLWNISSRPPNTQCSYNLSSHSLLNNTNVFSASLAP